MEENIDDDEELVETLNEIVEGHKKLDHLLNKCCRSREEKEDIEEVVSKLIDDYIQREKLIEI